MNEQSKSEHQPLYPEPARTTAAPRTVVNSSTSTPYVPPAAPPLRPGADDHKRHATRGMPT